MKIAEWRVKHIKHMVRYAKVALAMIGRENRNNYQGSTAMRAYVHLLAMEGCLLPQRKRK